MTDSGFSYLLEQKPLRGLLLLTLMLACRSPAGANPLGEWEQLLHLSGVSIPAFDVAPDGTLFIATPTAIFRASPERPYEWSLVTEIDRFPIDLHAVSRDRLFALVRYGEVYRWVADSGWSPVGPIPDSLYFVDGGTRQAFVRDWWIPNTNEIYLAGQGGLLLHYDGHAWARVPADGLPALDWIQIDGDASKIVLAGDQIWQRANGIWGQLPGGAAEALHCGPMALVVRPGNIVVAGYWSLGVHCLLRFESGSWSAIGGQLNEFREHPFSGRLQSDGTALIWSRSGDVARVADITATITMLPLFEFIGAELHGGYLYFAGTNHNDGIVGRIPQR